MDELPEFKRALLEVMRQPIQERIVTISRTRLSVESPASYILMAGMNPCPCGHCNHPDQDCSCATGIVQRYLNKISGPLPERIDIHVEVVLVAVRGFPKEQILPKPLPSLRLAFSLWVNDLFLDKKNADKIKG